MPRKSLAERLVAGLRARGVRLPDSFCPAIWRNRGQAMMNKASGNCGPTWELSYEGPRGATGDGISWEFAGKRGETIVGHDALSAIVKLPPERWCISATNENELDGVWAPGELRVMTP